MSVTFRPEEGPIRGWTFVCAACEIKSTDVYGAYEDALAALPDVVIDGCERDDYCRAFLDAVFDEEAPYVNVSNENARFILDALGYADSWGDLCGDASADDFYGRILVATAVAPADEGVPVRDEPGPGARMVHCGRPTGYLQDRLDSLREVAEWARERGRAISWS